MDYTKFIELGALACIAFMMIAKDSKRDNFIENLMDKMSAALDRNTAAISDLRDEFRKGKVK